MKWIYYCCATVLLLSWILVSGSTVNAMESGFATDSLSEEKKDTFLANSDISLVESDPGKKSIECFDVNENKLIAIGQAGSGNNKTICIYSENGEFLYGYSFNCTGAYAVEWVGNNLNIYYVRGSIIATVDPSGTVLDIAGVPDTIDNNSYYHNQLCSTERICGDTVYEIRNDMGIFNWFAISYSQLVSISHTNEETILYNVSSDQTAKGLAICVIIIILIPSVILIVLHYYKRRERS